jgi:hypothetical protein
LFWVTVLEFQFMTDRPHYFGPVARQHIIVGVHGRVNPFYPEPVSNKEEETRPVIPCKGIPA